MQLLIAATLASAFACVAASSTSKCAAIETCYEGGAFSALCTVAQGGCPPCVTFDDNGCYLQVDGGCPFGVDCSSAFSSSSRSNSSTTSSTAGSSSSATAASSTSTSGTGSSAQGESVVADSSSGGSNTVLVVAILAVALGVAILAVILRKLFLRARAAAEENQEEDVPSPPATVMTASFSSDGTTRDAHAAVSRSAMGTDLSTSKTSAF